MTIKKVRFISIDEAAKITGISITTLRRGVQTGRFPATRVGAGQSKILFDEQLLLQTLRNEALGNVTDEQPRSYLASLFQKPADEDEVKPSSTFTP